ncbi:MAG: hypothetical protein ACYCX3_12645 [Thermoleophilia bacterium]
MRWVVRGDVDAGAGPGGVARGAPTVPASRVRRSFIAVDGNGYEDSHRHDQKCD